MDKSHFNFAVVLLLIPLGALAAVVAHQIDKARQEGREHTAQIIDHIDGLTDTVAETLVCPEPPSKYTPLVIEMAEEISNVNRTLPYHDAIAYGEAIEQASERYSLDPRFILGVILTESTARASAKNGDCFGPMQVSVKWWDKALHEAGIITHTRDYFKIMNGVMAGAYVLDHYIGKHEGDLDDALDAYSGGAKNYASKVYLYGGIL